MSLYYEIVGFAPDGKYIQKGYDYGYVNEKPYKSGRSFGIYIYRITTTNEDGDIFEWPMLQVKKWCQERGFKSVPLLYYGPIANLLNEKDYKLIENNYPDSSDIEKTWEEVVEGSNDAYLRALKLCNVSSDSTKFVLTLGDKSKVILDRLRELYLEKDCFLCRNEVPGEGIVLRVEDSLEVEVYKFKSFRFLKKETEQLDSGEGDIESEN